MVFDIDIFISSLQPQVGKNRPTEFPTDEDLLPPKTMCASVKKRGRRKGGGGRRQRKEIQEP